MMMNERVVKVSLLVMHGSSIDRVPIEIDTALGIEFEFINWKTPNTRFVMKVKEEINAIEIQADDRVVIQPEAANRVLIKDG
jgi:hypothetical protein